MTEINPENGHGAADGFGGSDDGTHLMSQTAIVGVESSVSEINVAIAKAIADDESPLNGTQVVDATSKYEGVRLEPGQTYDSEAVTPVADTTPPPPGNGFLEQWAVWTTDSLKDLEEVCKAGLNPEERLVLCRTAYRFLQLAVEGADDSTLKGYPELQKELEDMALAFR